MLIAENKFESVMMGHSDEKLSTVLRNRSFYDAEAIDAAIVEAKRRGIITSREDMEAKFPLRSATTTSTAATEEASVNGAVREQATKDMIFGALWCVGGTVATMADIGFIFWGAIVFGGIQFFKGLVNMNK